MLSERQEQILESSVAEYINLALPVSSQHLQEYYDFGVSPATIRNELVALSEKGYLVQPHTSSGRVPTDKGYRFFVDKLLQEKEEAGRKRISFEKDPAFMLQEAARELAFASSLVSAVSWGNLFWKEGWGMVFSQPEFQDAGILQNFTRFVDDAEKNLQRFPAEDSVHVLIGRENRFSKAKDFSIMVRVCEVSGSHQLVLALLGPRRMAYEKNMQLLDSFYG